MSDSMSVREMLDALNEYEGEAIYDDLILKWSDVDKEETTRLPHAGRGAFAVVRNDGRVIRYHPQDGLWTLDSTDTEEI